MAAAPGPSGTVPDTNDNRWIFTAEQLANTPSKKCGLDSEKESNYRQQAASLIQDMGQKLQVTQLCINTAIVYMHRFYMFHSFSKFNRTNMAGACLFLAAKVEEQPRKLEHIVRTGYMCNHRDQPPLDVKSDLYLDLAQELVVDENILLQTLGFEITVDHPHTHIVKTCNLVRASKDLAQTSYFLATNSLHLTSMCLQYPPTVVACVCIHLACKWSSFEIPQSSEGKAWFSYVDPDVTSAMLEAITQDFLAVLEKCPSKIRKKLTNHKSIEEMPSHIFSVDSKRMSKAEPSATVSDGKLSASRSGERDHALPSSSSGSAIHSSAPMAADQGPGKDNSTYPTSVAASRAAPVSAAAGNFKFTNHERTLASAAQSASSATVSVKVEPSAVSVKVEPGMEQLGGVKTSTAPPTTESSGAVTPMLRRVKTEASTLSTKEYFERKQREQVEREKNAAASIQKIKAEVAAAGSAGVRIQSPPAKMIKLEVASSKQSDRGIGEVLDKPRGGEIPRTSISRDKLGPVGESVSSARMVNDALPPRTDALAKLNSVGSPIISNRLPKGNPEMAVAGSLAPGDLSEQRSTNIFERMSSSESKSSERNKESLHTAQRSKQAVDVDGSSKLHPHLSAQQYTTSRTISSSTAPDVGSLERLPSTERGRSERRHHDNSVDPLSIAKAAERRRSSRRDSGTGTPLSSPPNRPGAPQPGTDFGSPITVIGSHMPGDSRGTGHKRKRSSDSEHQQSPLKIKLSLPTGSSSQGHSVSPQKYSSGQPSSISSSRVSTEHAASAALSESQERIRLKLTVSEGRVEKVASPASAGVKIVLSKDKLSGAYQSGGGHSASSEQRRREHRHGEHHHHRPHKHHTQPPTDGDNGRHAAKNSVAADGQQFQQRSSQHRAEQQAGTLKVPADRHGQQQRHGTGGSNGNGHHSSQVSASAYAASRQQPQIASHISSTYRLAAITAASIPPPPPPPPLPQNDLQYSAMPPLPPQ